MDKIFTENEELDQNSRNSQQEEGNGDQFVPADNREQDESYFNNKESYKMDWLGNKIIDKSDRKNNQETTQLERQGEIIYPSQRNQID